MDAVDEVLEAIHSKLAALASIPTEELSGIGFFISNRGKSLIELSFTSGDQLHFLVPISPAQQKHSPKENEMSKRDLPQSFKDEVFASITAEVTKALETIKTSSPTGSGNGGNEYFNLSMDTHGLYMQVQIENGELLSIHLTTKKGAEFENRRIANFDDV